MEEELTEEQTDKIMQFQEVTSIEDLNTCRDFLIQNQWNLEIAIQEQLNFRESVSSLNSLSTISEAQDISVINDGRFIRHVISDQFPISRIEHLPLALPVVYRGFFGYFSNYIYNILYITLPSIINQFFNIIFRRNNNNNQIVQDPLTDVLKFIHDYDIKYPQHPIFYLGTHAQALNDAKRDLKFLFVYLHSDSLQVQEFCTQTLGNYDVVEYINENMLFWGCDVLCTEGSRVSHTVNARDYPFMTITGLKDNRMVLMGLMVGECSPTELLRRLKIIVTDNTIYLNQARQERLERNVTQTLRLQQDIAFTLSLRADEEKEQLRQIQRDEILKAELIENNKLMEEHKRRDEIAKLKTELSDKTPLEPPLNSPNSIHFVFKLPNGERIQRRFLITNTVNDIYNFIFCHPHTPDSFEITTNFPKRIIYAKELSAKCQAKLLNEIGLKNREVLFINDLDA